MRSAVQIEQSTETVNVLIVDDNPNNLRVLDVMLADMGHNLVRARSGKEALEALLEREFAVILLDIQMSGIDGFETAVLIRERERSRKTPILFVTTIFATDRQTFKKYSMDAVDYLFKPFVPEVLRAKISLFAQLFKKDEKIRLQEQALRELFHKEEGRQLADTREWWKMRCLQEEVEKGRIIANEMAQKLQQLDSDKADRDIVPGILCSHCQSQYIRRSHRRSFEWFVSLILAPYRCVDCGHRFIRFCVPGLS